MMEPTWAVVPCRRAKGCCLPGHAPFRGRFGCRQEPGAWGAAALAGRTLVLGHVALARLTQPPYTKHTLGAPGEGPELTAWFLAGRERQHAEVVTSLS